MAAHVHQASFYVIGGTLHRDAPSYVQRQADFDLYTYLNEGRFCYVLTSRQMGKSSLMVRAAVRLREEGASVAVLDLTAIGQNLTAEQWYDGLLNRTGRQLDLEDELEEFWLDHERLAPFQRWMRAIREVVLERCAGRVIIFIDEIDAVRSLPFSMDEFFAGVREFYNRRTEDPEINRLTFCLLGVAIPSDLIRDTRTTPFNIGQRIELTDFTEREAAQLALGLGRDDNLALALVRRILYWTGGHPYLTQRLCLAAAEDRSVSDAAGVDQLCEQLFLSTRAREQDDNLLFVRERMLRGESDVASILDLYGKVRSNKRVKDDETSPLISHLRLAGITRVKDGRLRVRNRVYDRVFDKEWITANMPDAELRRQRAAYRRGLLRAAAVASVVLAIMIGLALTAVRQRYLADQRSMEAQVAAEEARAAERETARAKEEADNQREQAELQRVIAEMQRAKAEREEKTAQAESRKASDAKRVAEDRLNQVERLNQRLKDQTDDYIWALIKDDGDHSSFETYLKQFPNGRHAVEANQRLIALTPVSPDIIMTATLAGQVRDKAAKAVAGARIIAVNEETGKLSAAQTDKAGRFLIDGLPVGIYKLTASKEGFMDVTVNRLLVQAKQENAIELSLSGLSKRRQ